MEEYLLEITAIATKWLVWKVTKMQIQKLWRSRSKPKKDGAKPKADAKETRH